MFIGHIGVGLSLKRVDRTINAGWIITASFFLDILLWLLVFFRIEGVTIPEDYNTRRYLYFDFPYSHSLVATILWSAVVFGIARLVSKSNLTASVLSLAVFSHFLLDVLVHPAQIPLLGIESTKIGFGLWNSLYLEMILEFLLLCIGFWIYAPFLTRRIKLILGAILLTVTAISMGGQLAGPDPESSFQVAISSFSLIVLLIFLFFYFDKKRTTS